MIIQIWYLQIDPILFKWRITIYRSASHVGYSSYEENGDIRT